MFLQIVGDNQMMSLLLKHKGGNFSALFALSLPALLLSAGLAVDVSRMMAAKNALQNSVDAALLAASRQPGSPEERRKFYQDYLIAQASLDPFLSNVMSDFEADVGLNYIETNGSATADVDLTIMNVFRSGSTRISVAAQAFEATDAIEVVMVLDNTGSMQSNNRMPALRAAATDLVNILADVKEKNPNRRIRIGLVPFVTAVNIKGEGFSMDWIDKGAKATYQGVNFDPVTVLLDENDPAPADDLATASGRVSHLKLFERIGVEWKGCVEARPRAIPVDASPNPGNPDTLFVPYFAPDEPDIDHNSNNRQTYSFADGSGYGDDGTYINNSYLDDMIESSALNGLTNAQRHNKRQRSLDKYVKTNPKLVSKGVREAGPRTAGPNRACPTPIVPLTDDFKHLRAEIAKMQQWNGSGTNVAEGLAWGTRVLSPNEPFTQGDPFDEAGTKKVVVLLTDGENVVFGASNSFNRSDYGAYGYLASNRFDGATAQGTAARKVDSWVLGNCTMLKDRDVDIYTVVLQADTAANRALYSACATTPDSYYPTNDVGRLREVFQKIANQVAALHFTH